MTLLTDLKKKLKKAISEIEINVLYGDYNRYFECVIEDDIVADIKLILCTKGGYEAAKTLDESRLTPEYAKDVFDRYNKKYCPDHCIRQLNEKNREKYFHLRLKVDKAIEEAKPYVQLD